MSTPIFQVTMDGADVSDAVATRLLSLTVRDNAGEEADSFVLDLDDGDGDNTPHLPLPIPQQVVEISMGYAETGLVWLGKFYVNEIQLSGNPGREMRVHGESVNMASAVRTTRSDAWDDTDLGTIVSTIAGRNGLTPIIDGDLAGIPIEHLDQMARSDMHFVSQLAVEYRAVAKVIDDNLILAKRGAGASITGGEIGNVRITLGVDDVLSWNSMFQIRGNNGAIKARWYDWDLGQTVEEEAPMVDGAASTKTITRRFAYPEDAQRAAGSESRRLDAARGRVTVEMCGKPEIVAEGFATLANFRDPIDRMWKIKSVEHTFDAAGFRTVLEGEYPEDGGAGGDGGADLPDVPIGGGGVQDPQQ